MGFSKGWGVVIDQLVEYVRSTPMTDDRANPKA